MRKIRGLLLSLTLLALPMSMASAADLQVCIDLNGKAFARRKCKKSDLRFQQGPSGCVVRRAQSSGISGVTATLSCNEDEYLQTYSCNGNSGLNQISETQLQYSAGVTAAVGVTCVMVNLAQSSALVELTVDGVCCSY